MTRRRINPVYIPLDDGSIPLYEGDLGVSLKEGPQTAPGRLELRIDPRPELEAWVTGQAVVGLFVDDNKGRDQPITILSGASLQPPSGHRPELRKVNESTFHVEPVIAGDLSNVASLVFHFGGALGARSQEGGFAGGANQAQIGFELPGWKLTLIPGDPRIDGFSALVKAEPETDAITIAAVEGLDRRLFLLLSFVANREVGAGAIAGLDLDGNVTWTSFSRPRLEWRNAAIRWCPELLIGDALPMVAAGLAKYDEDEAMIQVIDRAIGYSLAANDESLLDVKIPIACSGLELLSWAVLQREGVMRSGDERRKLGAEGMLQKLLEWAEVPSPVPTAMADLEERRDQRCEAKSAGPDVLFNVRNALVHPPKRLDDPEWPEPEELFQAWQLATWYLELGLLRTLDYNDRYWSRLRLGRSAYDLDPVPWIAENP